MAADSYAHAVAKLTREARVEVLPAGHVPELGNPDRVRAATSTMYDEPVALSRCPKPGLGIDRPLSSFLASPSSSRS
jgi:hypothetical protein